ncbi:hypothetical protein COU75_03095 [Candidatus Peregrinibacteria bacterium CG10_big_fil_rev_8_21_14_0_10_42_8]|nr:MAG: hypothetical protein COU75_03095 [Candidatus Peregrinibacteria bacterium CG10_big_fil_rev_8_21_14_0_10_42_8]
MPHLLRTTIMIVSAMIGSAIVLAGLIIVVGNLTTYGSIPADFLPSEHTVAIFHNTNQETLSKWSSHFPALSEASYGEEAIIGIIQNSDSTFSAAIFQKSGTGTLGQYNLQFTDSKIQSLIGKQQFPVSKNRSYKLLAEHHGLHSWIYMKVSALPAPHGLRNTIEHALLYRDSNYIGIQEEIDHIQISQETDQTFISAPLQDATLSGTIFRASIGEPTVVWKSVHQLLSKENTIIVDGIIQEKLTDWGNDISLEHDIMSLLSEPSTLHITESGGVINILIEGSVKNTQDRDRILDRIHSSYASILPTSTITRRVLDKRFSSVDIRHDESQITNSQFRNGNWTIRETLFQKNTHGMITATHKNNYLLSNNLHTIEEAITSISTTSPQSTAGFIVNQGLIDLSKVQVLLTPILAPKDRKTSLEDFANTLQWDTIINGLIMQKDLFF